MALPKGCANVYFIFYMVITILLLLLLLLFGCNKCVVWGMERSTSRKVIGALFTYLYSDWQLYYF